MVLKRFDLFERKGRTYEAKISIRKRGQIAFNQGLVNKYNLDRFKYAILFMSKNGEEMAIQFTNESLAEGTGKIIKRPGNFAITGKPFCDFHGIPYDKAKSYRKIKWFENESALVVDLEKRRKK
jgi:hypothetical protein